MTYSHWREAPSLVDCVNPNLKTNNCIYIPKKSLTIQKQTKKICSGQLVVNSSSTHSKQGIVTRQPTWPYDRDLETINGTYVTTRQFLAWRWFSNRLWSIGILKVGCKKTRFPQLQDIIEGSNLFWLKGVKSWSKTLYTDTKNKAAFGSESSGEFDGVEISMVTGNRCKSTTWKQTQYGTQLEELGKMICSFLVLTSSHMSSNIDHMLIYDFGGQFGAPTEYVMWLQLWHL